MSAAMEADFPAENSAHDRLWELAAENVNVEVEPDIQEQRASAKDYFESYEFVELLACIALLLPGLFLEFYPPDPRHRPIPYQVLESTGDYIVNQVYNESFDGETFSTEVLMVYSIAVPVFIQLLLSKLVGPMELHKSCCVYFASLGLTLTLTNILKLYVGYLRPIFLDVCQPSQDYSECTSSNDGARKSWPSGHSSISFCGLGLLSLYLEQRFGEPSIRSWKVEPHTGRILLQCTKPVRFLRILSIVCYTPMLFAGWIASSRIVDNKHFPADVVSGAVLGGAIAFFIHRIWFPSFPTVIGRKGSFTPRGDSIVR